MQQRSKFIQRTSALALAAVLANDPRPSYQNDPSRVYGFFFAGLEVRFTVADGVLCVCEIVKNGGQDGHEV